MRTPEQSVDVTQVTEWDEGSVRSVQDSLAAEEPLEVRIGESPLTVTMRTPGHDRELAAGFLLTEGIIESADQIAEIRSEQSSTSGRNNVVQVELRDVVFDSDDLRRNFFAASVCDGPTPIFVSIRRFCVGYPRSCDRTRRSSAALVACMPRPSLMLPER
jgi:FdhD protein